MCTWTWTGILTKWWKSVYLQTENDMWTITLTRVTKLRCCWRQMQSSCKRCEITTWFLWQCHCWVDFSSSLDNSHWLPVHTTTSSTLYAGEMMNLCIVYRRDRCRWWTCALCTGETGRDDEPLQFVQGSHKLIQNKFTDFSRTFWDLFPVFSRTYLCSVGHLRPF